MLPRLGTPIDHILDGIGASVLYPGPYNYKSTLHVEWSWRVRFALGNTRLTAEASHCAKAKQKGKGRFVPFAANSLSGSFQKSGAPI